MTCHQQDKKEKDVDSLGKRRKTSQSEDVSSSDCKVCQIGKTFFSYSHSTFSQEEVFRSGRDDRPSVILSERKVDSSAGGNTNKVKVMATQLLAKFEENAPAQHTGLKRQVWDEVTLFIDVFRVVG